VNSNHYDCLIIGAGMSGMAAGIRLAMYGKKVAILEKHRISGGLNSYYQRGKREFDVGLHALTNFVPRGARRKPLTKLLKQLRLPYEALKLNPQHYSQVVFPETTLRFTNQIDDLCGEISREFPHQIDGFMKLLSYIEEYDETALDNPYIPAKHVVREYITEPELLEMIFCPLLIYGSAWEDDMDFSQFVIMFKSIFLEGFGRPEGGVRTIINLLLEKLEEVGCEVRFKCGVDQILHSDGKVRGVLTDKGEELTCDRLLSSAGYPETLSLLQDNKTKKPPPCRQNELY
jgi:phytoene dehydrogenase-like protein